MKKLYTAPGTIIVSCDVTFIKNGRTITVRRSGSDTSMNINATFQKNINNAMLDAIYKVSIDDLGLTATDIEEAKHAGGSGYLLKMIREQPRATLIDYDIFYDKDKVRLKRINRGGHYYSVTYDKVTNKKVLMVRWKNGKAMPKEEFSSSRTQDDRYWKD